MKANLKLRAVHGRSCIWLSVFVFQFCFQLSASSIYWTAFVEVRYFDRVSNETVDSICECGLFEPDSPLGSVSGLLVLPNSDPLACLRNTTFTAKHQPWIALIKKGQCTHSQKIRAARRHGASAVVIYSTDVMSNVTNKMARAVAKGIVAITVDNILGTEMANLVKNGLDVYVAIMVAKHHGLWYSGRRWAYSLSFTFIGVTAIAMFYFAFIFIKRMCRNQQLQKQEREMKRENEKAIAKLEVRTLRTGDPEVESEDVSCVVCTDSFKHHEQVTVLPCRHLYHKKCIEPWLLEHPTCPMCKFHILKYKIDEESDEPSSGDTLRLAVIRTEQLLTSENTHTLGRPSDSEPEIQTQHIYENIAFEEEEAERTEHQDVNSQD